MERWQHYTTFILDIITVNYECAIHLQLGMKKKTKRKKNVYEKNGRTMDGSQERWRRWIGWQEIRELRDHSDSRILKKLLFLSFFFLLLGLVDWKSERPLQNEFLIRWRRARTDGGAEEKNILYFEKLFLMFSYLFGQPRGWLFWEFWYHFIS